MDLLAFTVAITRRYCNYLLQCLFNTPAPASALETDTSCRLGPRLCTFFLTVWLTPLLRLSKIAINGKYIIWLHHLLVP